MLVARTPLQTETNAMSDKETLESQLEKLSLDQTSERAAILMDLAELVGAEVSRLKARMLVPKYVVCVVAACCSLLR